MINPLALNRSLVEFGQPVKDGDNRSGDVPPGVFPMTLNKLDTDVQLHSTCSGLAVSDSTVSREFGDASQLVTEFGDEAHQQGLRLAAYVHLGAASVMRAGKILQEAFEIFGGKGRDSKFNRWLATYAPELHRRTADRWREVYVTFETEFQADPDIFSHFRLTALYSLADASPKARQALLEIAKGEVVTQQTVKQVIEKLETKNDARKVIGRGTPTSNAIRSADPSGDEARLSHMTVSAGGIANSSSQLSQPWKNARALSRHVLCEDRDLARVIKGLEGDGYAFHSTNVAIPSDGVHWFMVNGVRGDVEPATREFKTWIEVRDPNEAAAQLADRLTAIWPGAQCESFSPFT